MSRNSKWKLEKNKVKVVFRLQFHATHVPHSGWDKLFISFIPADTGKASAKTTKANVRNGTCKWADPIYETTRLFQDSQSKQYDEKFYKTVVAMGSSRSSILGEVIINLADYVDALKPFTVALPLQGCSYGTVLHMTIQLLTSKTGFREFEQQRELRERGFESGINSHGHSATNRVPTSDEVNARAKLKLDSTELSSLEEEAALNEEYADSATGFDVSSNTSGSLYAEKHETSSTHDTSGSLYADKHETLCTESTLSGKPDSLSHYQSLHAMKEDVSDHPNFFQESNGSARLWGSENSIDNNLATVLEENSKLRGSLELAESSIFSLKLEVVSLQNLADEYRAETRKFSHVLAAEFSSSEVLTKEVALMKSNCLKLRDDINAVKNLKLRAQIHATKTNDSQADHGDRNVKDQFLKGIVVMEGKIRELLNNIYITPHDGVKKYIYLELEALLKFLLGFKLEGLMISKNTDVDEVGNIIISKDEQFLSGNVLGLDLCQPENPLQHLTPNPPASELVNPGAALEAMKAQIFDLVRELDDAKVEKESLAKKMDQMECYYESLIQELEEHQKNIIGELQHLRNEHSTCLYALSASEAEIESLRHDMDKQMQRFVAERQDLEDLNEKLDKRVTISEAALRRARLNYKIAVDRLQKDLELLSSQVTSMFETSESLIKQALPSHPLQAERETNPLKKPGDGDSNAEILSHLSKKSGLRERSLREDIVFEDLKRSSGLQEQLYNKVQNELADMYSVNVDLDVYSKALQESLRQADGCIRLMKEEMDELVQELELSTASQNELMVRLQKATEDIHALNEYRSSSISRCTDMSQENQLLENKLVIMSEENFLLTQKLANWESTMMECRIYQSKYEACLKENAELSLRLEQEVLRNEKLDSEVSLSRENYMTLKSESDELVSVKKNLEKNIAFMENKLANLLESYNQQFYDSADSPSLSTDTADIKDVILQLEKVQQDARLNNCQLVKENQNLRNERDRADASLCTVRSEILAMKQVLKSNIQDMASKVDVSNALVDRLQTELESVVKKFQLSSEIEKEYAEQNKVLLADLALLENQMQVLTCANGYLAQEVLCLDALEEELGVTKQTVSELMDDKQELTMRLQDKIEESVELSCEVSSLKDSLRSSLDDLLFEKEYRNELDKKFSDLTIELSKYQEKLRICEQQNAGLMHTREVVSDLESENSRLSHLLSQQNLLIEELETKMSYQASLEKWVLELHDYSLATDIKLTYVASQYESLLEHLPELVALEGRLIELQKRHRDKEAMLSQYVTSEARWNKEKANLITTLNGLRCELEAAGAQNKLLSDSNTVICRQLEEGNSLHVLEVKRLKSMMEDTEEQMISLTASKEEMEILVMILKEKLQEQFAEVNSNEERKDEVMMLRSRCNELSSKLSEQVKQTEEFRNLSAHLKEVKDKDEAECLMVRERSDSEVPTVAAQDSLRIAFMKEQYETRIEELKQQLSIFKKHGEEMLLKLQDAINEVENRKKLEAANLKRNDEMSLRLTELETALQSAVVEKREKSQAYDRTKAELECALQSLECCKEEKEKIGASVLEFEAEKSQLATELFSLKRQLENLRSSMELQRGEHISGTEVEHTVNGSVRKSFPLDLEQDESGVSVDGDNILPKIYVENTYPVVETVQDDDVRRVMQLSTEVLASHELPQSSGQYSDIAIEDPGAQRLKSSFEHFYNELEKMKNENAAAGIDHDLDRDGFQVPDREIMQLHRVNEELRSMFPSPDDILSDGNALQKVLAFEMELAEALKSKNKLKLQSQSSILKQHGDDEAIFKSFRDINELIREMLELKGRQASTEAELRDMHERYSQLSLQFAEVEGERQKLEMTLKAVRSTRKIANINRSSSASIVEKRS